MKIHPSALNDSRPGARTSSVTAPRQNPPSGHRPSGRRPRHDTKKYTEDTNMPPIEPVASLPTTINARRRGFSPSLQNARQGEHVVPLGACVRLKHDYYVVRPDLPQRPQDATQEIERDNRCAKKRKTATWFHYEIQRATSSRLSPALASRTLLRMLPSGIDNIVDRIHHSSAFTAPA